MMVSLRNALVGNKEEPSTAGWQLCFTAEEAGSTVKLRTIGSPPTIYLATSLDGQTWQDHTIGDVITLQNVGDKIYFAASGNATNTQISSGARQYRKFEITGKFAVSGNLMSLVKNDPTGWDVQIGGRCFYQLFHSCGITTAPELPGTKLNEYCYYGMFYGCTQLRTVPPVLPSLGQYAAMYRNMFYNCTSIEKSPEIMLLSNDAQGCMYGMFSGCTALNEIKVHFTGWNGSAGDGNSTTQTWVYNVASSGTFYCPSALGTNETITRGTSNCPANWTVVNI